MNMKRKKYKGVMRSLMIKEQKEKIRSLWLQNEALYRSIYTKGSGE